jgi:hypothetical protein
MEIVRVTPNDEHISAVTVLVRRRVSDERPGLVVKIPEKPRCQVER